jgi:hypothetical protein
MKRLLRSSAWSLVVFGVAGLLLSMAVAFGALHWRWELPWSDVQGVQCRGEEVYVGLGFFSTVLVYDRSGELLRSIPISTHAKPYIFRINADGTVRTTPTHATRRAGRARVVRTEGFGRILRYRCSDEAGGELRQSLWFLLLAGPLPCAQIAFAGVLGVLALDACLLLRLFTHAAKGRA